MWTFVRRTRLEGKGDLGLHAMVQMPADRYDGQAGLIGFAPEVALPAGTPPNAATNAVARGGAEIELVRRRQLDQVPSLKNAHNSQ
jgi:hypothetical protein